MENYKSLEAYKFHISGWVGNIFHMELGSLKIFKADCKPSYRVNNEPHHPWVAIENDTGIVLAAHCDCMAGLGESCSHVGAILFKMEWAVRHELTRSNCTDVLCQWNAAYLKNIIPEPIYKMKFYGDEQKNKLSQSIRQFKSQPSKPTSFSQNNFLHAINAIGENVVGLVAFDSYAKSFVPSLSVTVSKLKLPPPLNDLYKKEYANLNNEDLAIKCDELLKSLKITVEEAKYVEEVTKAQSLSPVWHTQRCGRITASVAHRVLHTNLISPSSSLIYCICYESKPVTVPAIMWGKEKEKEALNLYKRVLSGEVPSSTMVTCDTGNILHTNVLIQGSGLVICEEYPHFGCSPDGIIKCACCSMGVVEIKCPYKYRYSALSDAVGDQQFCLDSQLKLKPTHPYFTQIQFQMFVCKATYCDFVVWTTKHCLITRIKRNDDFIEAMISKFNFIWKASILPELLTRKLKCLTDMLPSTSSDTQSAQANQGCICGTERDSIMIGCDACDRWFHLECVKLKRVPKNSTWYCKDCKKQKKKSPSLSLSKLST